VGPKPRCLNFFSGKFPERADRDFTPPVPETFAMVAGRVVGARPGRVSLALIGNFTTASCEDTWQRSKIF
jgi:hypothetical protein